MISDMCFMAHPLRELKSNEDFREEKKKNQKPVLDCTDDKE